MSPEAAPEERHVAPLAAALLLAVLSGAAADDPQSLAKRAIASVKPQPTWGAIEILMATAKEYAIILNYKSTPSDMPVIENDLSAIARALVQTLVAAGHKPRDEEIDIRVDGFVPVTGETGAGVGQLHGSTRYRWDNDSFEFKSEADSPGRPAERVLPHDAHQPTTRPQSGQR